MALRLIPPVTACLSFSTPLGHWSRSRIARRSAGAPVHRTEKEIGHMVISGQGRRSRWIVVPVALGLLIAGLIMAQEEDLDHYVERVLAEQEVPGMSIAVVKGGEILLAKGYGFASLELGAPATAQSLYALGSMSKQFAATAVMMLVQDGDVRLDSPINR